MCSFTWCDDIRIPFKVLVLPFLLQPSQWLKVDRSFGSTCLFLNVDHMLILSTVIIQRMCGLSQKVEDNFVISLLIDFFACTYWKVVIWGSICHYFAIERCIGFLYNFATTVAMLKFLSVWIFTCIQQQCHGAW